MAVEYLMHFLHFIARYGEVPDLKNAIEHGCDVNITAEGSGNTALHMSAANGHMYVHIYIYIHALRVHTYSLNL